MSAITREIREYLSSLGRKGGKARLAKMTAEQRQAFAQKAAKARWEKEKTQRERKRE
jgi:hypothetical protein